MACIYLQKGCIVCSNGKCLNAIGLSHFTALDGWLKSYFVNDQRRGKEVKILGFFNFLRGSRFSGTVPVLNIFRIQG